ncbi:MAG: hypothetical protein U0793_13750 [Gemmataceae bacterium]
MPDLELAVYASLVGAVAVLGLVIVLIQSFRYLRRLTKENASR